MLKKATLAILSLTLSGLAAAGDMYSTPSVPQCTAVNVTVPCEAKLWNLGAQAVYLQPTYGAENGYERHSERTYKSINPQWGWGYRIEGSFHFGAGNDLTMTLLHYDRDTVHGHFIGFTPFSFSNLPLSVHLQNKFDQVNFVMGQKTAFSIWKKARFYGGLQYAKIRVDQNLNYLTVPPFLLRLGASGFQQYRNADTDGVGPVIGIDYSYGLIQGLRLTGNTSASILYGTTRLANGFVFAPVGLVFGPQNRSRKLTVPSFEAKLGLNYVHECVQGLLNIEAGYQVLNYFQAFGSSSNRFLLDTRRSNFGLYGPYFGAKWVGFV